jgi:hypothetical protein
VGLSAELVRYELAGAAGLQAPHSAGIDSAFERNRVARLQDEPATTAQALQKRNSGSMTRCFYEYPGRGERIRTSGLCVPNNEDFYFRPLVIGYI